MRTAARTVRRDTREGRATEMTNKADKTRKATGAGRIAATGLAAVLAAGLWGCGSAPEEPDDAKTEEVAEESVADEEEEIADASAASSRVNSMANVSDLCRSGKQLPITKVDGRWIHSYDYNGSTCFLVWTRDDETGTHYRVSLGPAKTSDFAVVWDAKPEDGYVTYHAKGDPDYGKATVIHLPEDEYGRTDGEPGYPPEDVVDGSVMEKLQSLKAEAEDADEKAGDAKDEKDE